MLVSRTARLPWSLCALAFLAAGADAQPTGPILGVSISGVGALVVAGGCPMVAAPVAWGFGIFGHGPDEIDRLISRTISYAVVTGLPAAVFPGIVVLAPRVPTAEQAIAPAHASVWIRSS
jgi:hypothetical protein